MQNLVDDLQAQGVALEVSQQAKRAVVTDSSGKALTKDKGYKGYVHYKPPPPVPPNTREDVQRVGAG